MSEALQVDVEGYMEAQLGEEAKAFLQTDLGRLIMERAQSDESAAREALSLLNPYEFLTLVSLQNAITEIQQDMIAGQRIAQYIQDAIVNGDVAWQNLNTREELE